MMMMPPLVLALALLALFSSVGLPLSLLTVILAHLTFTTPFVVLIVAARLKDLDQAIADSARDLGASPWAVFRTVTFPLVRPTILGAALIAMSLSRRLHHHLLPDRRQHAAHAGLGDAQDGHRPVHQRAGHADPLPDARHRGGGAAAHPVSRMIRAGLAIPPRLRPLPPLDPGAVAAVVAAQGTASFFPALRDLVQSRAPIDNMVAVVFAADRGPLTLFQWSPQEPNHFALLYSKGAYRLDPYHLRSLEPRSMGLHRLRDVAPDDFRTSDFWRTYYQKVGGATTTIAALLRG